MKTKVEILNKTKKFTVNKKGLKEVIKNILKYLEVGLRVDLDIAFVGNETIRKLNKEFRQKDKPTNVLSFVIDEKPNEFIYGEVIISLEKARSEAKKLGNNFNDYVLFLVIHGILHILGYDHENEKDRLIMENLEENLLKQFLRRGLVEIWNR